jgi:hypothetical protein
MRRRGLIPTVMLSSVLSATAAAALVPLHFASREELFEIPKGTWARRRAGDNVEILPSEIRLVIGLHDVLVLRNLDEVPQIFGPTLIMPGQRLRLPFEEVSENQFNCTAHVSGQLTVSVEDAPASPWARLRWRMDELTRRVSQLRWRDALHGKAQEGSAPARADLSITDRMVGGGAQDE